MDIGLTISTLVERFGHYAQNCKDIKHEPNSRKEAFFHMDIDSLQAALTSGIKFPALYLQTPESNKENSYDSIAEAFTFTYVIAVKDRAAKSVLLDRAKSISDKIFSRLNLDIRNGVINCALDGSDEGQFGPVGDEIYGWGVSITLTSPFDAQVKPEDWEDLS